MRGMEGVRAAAKARSERSAQFVPRNYGFFRLKNDGDSAVVRFLEQGDDVAWAWCHQVPIQGRQFGEWVPSLDQGSQYPGANCPCPLVQAGIKRSFHGWISLIWRDAPLFKKDSAGRLEKDGNKQNIQIGLKDQVAVWSSGIQVFEDLEAVDAQYKGLCSRDFRVTRKGAANDKKVSYQIFPADVDGGPQPMSPADIALANTKPNMAQFVAPKTYEQLARLAGGDASALYDTVDGGTQGGGQSHEEAAAVNPFLNRR